MFELELMDPNRHIRPTEILKATSVIKMQMAHDHSLDVLNGMPCFGDGLVELLVLFVVDACEEIVEWWTPDLWIIWSGARLKQDQPLCRMLDKSGDDDDPTADGVWVRVRFSRSAALRLTMLISAEGVWRNRSGTGTYATHEETNVGFEVAEMEPLRKYIRSAILHLERLS
jgi:hypothetical protein